MPASDIDRVWNLMESIRYCMLSNWSGSRLHSRPMGAFVRRPENAIYFFTDDRAHKEEEMARYPQVCLAFGDTHGQKYLSVSGTAETVDDHGKIEELWAIPAKAWWKTPGNPHVRLIKVTPIDAEYWDAPGNLVSDFKIAFALVTGGYPRAGDHSKVSL